MVRISPTVVGKEETALQVAGTLLAPGESRVEQQRLVATILAQYKHDPSAENRLALAMAYALVGKAASSNRKALALLTKLDTRELSSSSRLVAIWLNGMVTSRYKLEQRNATLDRQLGAARASLVRARAEIHNLTRIERSIGPAP